MGNYVRRVWDTYQGYSLEIDWDSVRNKVDEIFAVSLICIWVTSLCFAIASAIMLLVEPDKATWYLTLVSFLVLSSLHKATDLCDMIDPPVGSKEISDHQFCTHLFGNVTLLVAVFAIPAGVRMFIQGILMTQT